jgi:hypothetical protein
VEGLTIPQCGAELVELVKDVANGKEAKAELNQNDLFAILTVGSPF